MRNLLIVFVFVSLLGLGIAQPVFALDLNINAIVSGCGDGVIQGSEQCDGSNLNSQSCATQGFLGGTLSCDSNCNFNTSQCNNDTIESVVGGGRISTPAQPEQIEILLQKIKNLLDDLSKRVNDLINQKVQIPQKEPELSIPEQPARPSEEIVNIPEKGPVLTEKQKVEDRLPFANVINKINIVLITLLLLLSLLLFIIYFGFISF